MKTLNLKYWKDELHEAEVSGVEEIIVTPNELSRFINEIEMLRKKISAYPLQDPLEDVRIKW